MHICRCVMKMLNDQKTEKNCKVLLQPMSSLTEPFSEFIDDLGPHADGFALEGAERNDTALIKGEKVSAAVAVKRDVVNMFC